MVERDKTINLYEKEPIPRRKAKLNYLINKIK